MSDQFGRVRARREVSAAAPKMNRAAPPAMTWRTVDITTTVLAVALFALAAALRLDRLWLVEFKRDEAQLAVKALALASGHTLPLAGTPSSAGLLNLPGAVYLLAIPFRLWPQPIAGSAFLALLGAAAVVVCFWLGTRSFGRTTGLVAGLLYAVNPWAVLFSRKIWEPDTIHLFVVLFCLALNAFVVDQSRRAFVWATFLLVFLTQLHLSTVALIPVWLVGLIIGRRIVGWRRLLATGAIAVLTYAPYLYGDAQQGWVNVRAIIAQPTKPANLDLSALATVRELVSGFTYFLPDDQVGSGPMAQLGAWLLRYGGAILALLGVGSVVFRAGWGKGRQRHAAWLLLTWLAAPIVLALRHSLSLHVHYFLTIVPALALASGVGVETLGRLASRTIAVLDVRRTSQFRSRSTGEHDRVRWLSVRQFVGVALGLVVLAMSATQVSASRWFTDQIASGNRDRFLYGIPLTFTTTLADAIETRGDLSVRVVGATDDLAIALDTLLHDRVTVEWFNGTRAVPLPSADHAVYVVVEDGSPAASLLATAAAPWRVDEIDEHGRPVYTVYDLPGGLASALRQTVFTPSDLRFENGTHLMGVRVPRMVNAGETIDLAALWQVDQRPAADAQPTVVFGHLIDATDMAIAAAHDEHWPSRGDQGDAWITWLRIPVPSTAAFGAYTIDYGIFRKPGIQPVAVADATGRPLGTQIRLGPVKVEPLARPARPEIPHRLSVRFGSTIRLEGYDLKQGHEAIQVTLAWRAVGTPGVDYQAFVHIVDATGHLVAQSDAVPGALPTTLWDPGEVIQDAHTVRLPAGLPAGTYQVRAGLYALPEGRRLPISKGTATVIDDSVVIATLRLP